MSGSKRTTAGSRRTGFRSRNTAFFDGAVRRLSNARQRPIAQSGLLDELNTRFVVPLAKSDGSTATPARLNPTLVVEGERWVMKTHFAASVPARELRELVESLDHERYTILAAIDFMLGGF